MDFIKPKFRNLQKAEWKISKKTKLIVEEYSKYTGYSEDEVVDIFMQNVLKDSDFKNFLRKKRSTKKIKKFIFEEEPNEGDF